jgi:hypothetical protein
MKKAVASRLATGVLAVILANVANAGTLTAPSQAPSMQAGAAGRALIDLAFDAPAVEQVAILNDTQMTATRGDLWPFIFGVAAVDIGLAGFFWGVYVPTVAGPCRVCDVGGKSR